MVESKLVELVVAGSNPVGHPIFISTRSNKGSTNAHLISINQKKRHETAEEKASQQNHQDDVYLAPSHIALLARKK